MIKDKLFSALPGLVNIGQNSLPDSESLTKGERTKQVLRNQQLAAVCDELQPQIHAAEARSTQKKNP